MGLTVTVTPHVTLPDLTDLEAAAKENLARLVPLRDDVKTRLSERLAALKVTADDVRALIEQNPKLIDGQIRGKLATAARYEREIATWSGLVAAAKRVAEKDAKALFHVTHRPWGRDASRIVVRIVDKDLLLLRKAGVLGLE